jgi:hypothetical protein
MSQLLSDPRMVDYLIQSQPQLQALGPGFRQVMQSEEFRRSLTDPTMIRNMFEMNRMFTQMGMQAPGMPAAPRQPNFPAPGVTNTTAPPARGTPPPQQLPVPQTQQQPGTNPFEQIFQQPPQPPQSATVVPNPFVGLFAPQGAQPPYGTQARQTAPQTAPQTALNNRHPSMGQQVLGSTPLSQQPLVGGFPQQQQQQAQPPFGQQTQGTFGQGQQPQATFGQGQQPQAAFGQGQQPQATFGQVQQPQATFGQGQHPQLAFGQGQSSEMASMYSMLQTLLGQANQAGTRTHPNQTTFIPLPVAPPAADNRPLEERYQVNPHPF